MKKLLLILSMLIFIFIDARSQENYAIGLRTGGTSGLTFRMITSSGYELEGIAGFWNHGVSVTALYKKRNNAFDVNGLNWIYGGGAHISHYGEKFNRNNEPNWHTTYPDYVDYYTFGIGIDGVIGMEYKIPKIPIAVSFDYKPFLEVVSNGGVWVSMDPGIGIKFIF
ncbi:MAG: hypothetical protein A2041_05425 [Bacteroidetes bacterium GWA2_31_9b]|nr:MAG: hypothetical protein A2041_05425 [Bacteroidetes bacterium GWA2_31_9b]